MGLASSSTVHGHLARLEKKGLIHRDPTKPRALELLEYEMDSNKDFTMGTARVPVIGMVTAGEPILAVEKLKNTLSFLKAW
jgi:repressor LexA